MMTGRGQAASCPVSFLSTQRGQPRQLTPDLSTNVTPKPLTLRATKEDTIGADETTLSMNFRIKQHLQRRPRKGSPTPTHPV